MNAEANPSDLWSYAWPAIAVSCFFFYAIVCGAIWRRYQMTMDDWMETPAGTFSGLFWPVAIPFHLGWWAYGWLHARFFSQA